MYTLYKGRDARNVTALTSPGWTWLVMCLGSLGRVAIACLDKQGLQRCSTKNKEHISLEEAKC